MFKERISYFIDGKITYVEVERTKNKNMYLKVKEEGIIVSAPLGAKNTIVKAFVDEHINKFIKYIDKKNKNKLFSLQDDFFYFFGKKIFFTRLSGFKKITIKITESKTYIHTLTSSNKEVEKAIKLFLKKELMLYLNSRQQFFEKKMHTPEHIISATYKTTTWGTNNINTKKISYSIRLAHYRHEIIDYVIVHEIAHYFEPNHTSAFWNVVFQYISNAKELRKELKADTTLKE